MRLRLKIADRVGIGDAKSIEFELKRLSKTLVAVSTWARGVRVTSNRREPFLPRATWETMANSMSGAGSCTRDCRGAGDQKRQSAPICRREIA